MSLQSLGVGHNRLTSLPAEVALLTRLTWLGLDGNPLIIPTARSAARDAPRLGPARVRTKAATGFVDEGRRRRRCCWNAWPLPRY